MVRQKEAPFSATLDMQQNNPSPPVDRFCSVLPTLKPVYTRKKQTAQTRRSAVNCIRHELFCYRYGTSLCRLDNRGIVVSVFSFPKHPDKGAHIMLNSPLRKDTSLKRSDLIANLK
jgi:hypothetical protein